MRSGIPAGAPPPALDGDCFGNAALHMHLCSDLINAQLNADHSTDHC